MNFKLVKKVKTKDEQNVLSLYENLSKYYGVDFYDLVWGNDGFMKLNYPNGFPDFKEDIIYSEKYWKEFENWLKENKGIDIIQNTESDNYNFNDSKEVTDSIIALLGVVRSNLKSVLNVINNFINKEIEMDAYNKKEYELYNSINNNMSEWNEIVTDLFIKTQNYIENLKNVNVTEDNELEAFPSRARNEIKESSNKKETFNKLMKELDEIYERSNYENKDDDYKKIQNDLIIFYNKNKEE